MSGFIATPVYNTELNFDLILSGAVTILLILFMFTLHKNKLDRWEAFILLFGYVVYVSYLVIQG
jgi:Ca2+/Na+ antiporter